MFTTTWQGHTKAGHGMQGWVEIQLSGTMLTWHAALSQPKQPHYNLRLSSGGNGDQRAVCRLVLSGTVIHVQPWQHHPSAAAHPPVLCCRCCWVRHALAAEHIVTATAHTLTYASSRNRSSTSSPAVVLYDRSWLRLWPCIRRLYSGSPVQVAYAATS